MTYLVASYAIISTFYINIYRIYCRILNIKLSAADHVSERILPLKEDMFYWARHSALLTGVVSIEN